MPDFKLFEMRMKLTSGTKIGKFYLLLSLIIGALSFQNNRFSYYWSENEKTPKCNQNRNEAIDIHYTVYYCMYVVMLIMLGVCVIRKLASVFGFLLCPLFQLRVKKMTLGKDIFKNATETDNFLSEKTLKFRMAVK